MFPIVADAKNNDVVLKRLYLDGGPHIGDGGLPFAVRKDHFGHSVANGRQHLHRSSLTRR